MQGILAFKMTKKPTSMNFYLSPLFFEIMKGLNVGSSKKILRSSEVAQATKKMHSV